jgi:glycosyltransferase involved in cell wall biosynthesis
MSLEQKINYQLNKYPKVKKVVKSAYQHIMYAISPKIKAEGDIVRMSPEDMQHEYFFGYYDKCPWDITDRYLLCLKANDTWSDVSPKQMADILLIDTKKNKDNPERYKKIAETRSWNVQQSCMLQWLGPDFSSKIIYNDYRNGKYVSIVLTLDTGEERIIEAPTYSVSADGKTALTLDFSRLYNLRPGYGYYNIPEKTKGVALPDSTAVWKINIETGVVEPLLKYTDFAKFQPRHEMQEKRAIHKVNHLMISPNGQRFMVLYRWFIGDRKYTRLITCNIDGTGMYVLSDDDMVSHCFWKSDNEILAFENKKNGGTGYYLMKDKTRNYVHCWPQLTGDGHPSYNNDRSIVTDSYPDRARIQYLRVMDSEDANPKIIAKVFSPFKYDNDTRCDLHPRWNHAGDKICFDGVFEGSRGLYVVKVGEPCSHNDNSTNEMTSRPKYSIVTPVYNSFNLMGKYFDTLERQSYKNFEVIMIDDCSTDGSYEQLLQYSKKTCLNMCVLRSDINSGPGNARNIGIQNAKGEWITFIDNDDWVSTSFLKKIDDAVIKNQTNCIIYDYLITNGEKTEKGKSMYRSRYGYVSVSDCISYVRNHTFGKVYRLDCLREKEINYPKLRRCEDVAFVCQAIKACGGAYYLNEALYYYFQHKNSLSNNIKLDESDMIKAFAILEKELGTKYPGELKEKSVTDILYGVLLMMCKSGKSNKEIKKYIKSYEKKYPEWWKCEIINDVGKAKRVFFMMARYKNIAGLKALAYIHSQIIGS